MTISCMLSKQIKMLNNNISLLSSINPINMSATSESKLIELMNSILAFEDCEHTENSYINPKDVEIDNSSGNESENTSNMDIADNNVVNNLNIQETPDTNSKRHLPIL